MNSDIIVSTDQLIHNALVADFSLCVHNMYKLDEEIIKKKTNKKSSLKFNSTTKRFFLSLRFYTKCFIVQF